MEMTNYQKTGTYDYNAWRGGINCDILSQYACFREPLKYNDVSVRREHKDLLFRILMQDKENLLSVYNALNGTDYENTDELEIVTLEDAVYIKYKNDVSFLFQSYLTLYEHQSTFNPNMPLRDLFYVTSQLGMKYANNRCLYGRKQIKIPTPKFVVFYNGNEKRPENEILKLSDAFEKREEEPELELKVRVININKGYNEKIKKACRVLREYGEFTDCIRKNREHYEIAEAVVKAVDECIQREILKDFLVKQKSEVIETMLFECNEEEVLEYLKQEEYEMGLEAGETKGKTAGLVEAVTELLAMYGPIPEKLMECIDRETDLKILHKWLLLAAKTSSVEEFEKLM